MAEIVVGVIVLAAVVMTAAVAVADELRDEKRSQDDLDKRIDFLGWQDMMSKLSG